MVYFGSGDGRLYALDARTGQEKWRFKTDGGVNSSPAVAGGVVYFGSTDGYLYAVR
jgi:outer membrane protein assembly factor BamB